MAGINSFHHAKKSRQATWHRHEHDSGFVLITALIFVIVVGALLASGAVSSLSNRRLAADNKQTVVTQVNAESGIEQTIANFYNTPLSGLSKDKRSLLEYRKALDGLGLNDGASQTVSSTIGVGTNAAGGFSATITRKDVLNQSNLYVVSTGIDARGGKRVVAEDFFVTGGTFKGFDYALLTNNANCIFCHADVNTTESAYGTPGKATQRAKVGTLESLEIRPSSADTKIGGTLYTRGTVKDSTAAVGTSLTDSQIANSSVKSINIATDGTVNNTTAVNLTPQDCTVVSSSNCTVNNNMYKNYPSGEAAPDGELPNTFPPAIQDLNADRKIDDSEWSKAVAGQCSGGTISGGQINRLAKSPATQAVSTPTGTTSTWGSQKVANSLVAGGSVVSGIASGEVANLILKGSPGALTINGTVCVDGDVVISGRVLGEGKIIARGNVYVVGDLEYDCGGRACNNTERGNGTKLPKFGLAALGNMTIGDYASAQNAGNDLVAKDKLNLMTGKPNFAFGEMLSFNKKERAKAIKDTSYIPRYYTRFPGDPVRYFSGSGESASDWLTDTTLVESAYLGNAVKVAISPAVDAISKVPWITEAQIKEMVINNLELPVRAVGSDSCGSSVPNKPLTVDGLLYSSNAIFALSRGASKLNGQMTLNGSMVAADTGVLTPGSGSVGCAGLRVHYDARLKDFFSIQTDEKISLTHGSYRLVKQ